MVPEDLLTSNSRIAYVEPLAIDTNETGWPSTLTLKEFNIWSLKMTRLLKVIRRWRVLGLAYAYSVEKVTTGGGLHAIELVLRHSEM